MQFLNNQILYAYKVTDLYTGEVLGANQTGEICSRGPQIMKGNVNYFIRLKIPGKLCNFRTLNDETLFHIERP